MKVRMKMACSVLALGLLFGSAAFPAAALAKEHNGQSQSSAASQGAGKLEVQLVCDQHTAMEGGDVTVHILYHNVSNKNMDHAWLKLRISDKAEVKEAIGADWDAAAGMLLWQLKEVAAGNAGVVQLTLKVKSGVSIGDFLELKCEGDDDDGLAFTTAGATLNIGTELHQPAFNGYPDGQFHPQGLLTRAETAAILSRLELLPAAAADDGYTDVPASHWAAAYIAKVTQAGWMTGADGRFRPDAPITRGELAVLLLRVRGIEALPLKGFDDSDKHWAKDSIGTGKALGYLSGDAQGRFDPNSPIRRDDAAKLLTLALTRGELRDGDTKVVQHWPDVPRSAWSFGWIEELSLLAHVSKEQGAAQERLIRYAPENTLPF